MARARNIKPSFFTNEQVSDNCPLGRLLFIGLWTMADYKGDLEWREKTLKIQLLPWDECNLKELAINLDKSGLIRFYSDGNKIYLNIPNFEKHQNPHKNEREKGSDIPAYSERLRQVIDLKGLTINRDKSGALAKSSRSDRADSLLMIPDSHIPNPESNTNSDELVSAPTKKQKRQTQKNLNAHTPDDELDFSSWPDRPSEQVWTDYKKMRSTKRAWITQTIVAHLGRVLLELANSGYPVDQIFTIATMRNWTGLEAHWVLNNYSVSAHGPPPQQFLNSRERNSIRSAKTFDYHEGTNFGDPHCE